MFHLYNLIDTEINGYGPLTELLEDDNITFKIIEVYNNRIKKIKITFQNDEENK